MKSSQDIRQAFLTYFAEREHSIVPSAPIVVKNDPTLLFTNAGMNQFKDAFLGNAQPEAPRIADTQKCMRVSGKHNDLDEVGHDTYHHTMFEMLGNWSFGNYYKPEAIEWAWDLLTRVYGIDKDRLYITVFGGDDEDGLPADVESREQWQKYTSDDRILDFDKKDNFWEMGDVGPCGPCSEIHVDIRPEDERSKVDGASLVNRDHPHVIEIWNLVFMEFNRQADRSLEPLPAKSVDTGMGYERLCMVLQGVRSNYDTDLFQPYKDYMQAQLDLKYGQNEEKDIAMRVVMDHLRAICFSIADGQIPSNTGAGYVVRRILRRASRYAFKFLGQSQPFLHGMVAVAAKIYADIFPELGQQVDFISRIVEEEEKSFLAKLERGTQMFEDYIAEHRSAKVVDGEFAFRLFDTYGFPVDLTAVMAREKGMSVDQEGFDQHMAEQKQRSKSAAKVQTGDWVPVKSMEGLSEFVGYDSEEMLSEILRYRTVKTKKGEGYQLVLERTPFYAESGGQVGDTGFLRKDGESIRVLDTKKENDLIVHLVDKLPEDPEGTWTAEINHDRRRLIRANHSATHLLHAALRQVLGEHVEQRGSLVSDKLLRFDFSHFAKMTDEELKQVENIVNERIAAAIPLQELRDIPIEEAKNMGAMALFGEKYGDQVRVIVFDPGYSVELCGGTHVSNSSEIRLFKLVSESSIAAGIRRVEAYTSDRALQYLSEQFDQLQQVKAALKNPKDAVKAVEDLLDKQKKLEKEIEQLHAEQVSGLKDGLKAKFQEINGINLLAEVVEVPSGNELRSLCFDLRNVKDRAVLVLGAKTGDKALLNVVLTQDLVDEGKLNAGQLVRELAKEIKGGGGGQAHFASAGGKDPSGLPAAIAKAKDLI